MPKKVEEVEEYEEEEEEEEIVMPPIKGKTQTFQYFINERDCFNDFHGNVR